MFVQCCNRIYGEYFNGIEVTEYFLTSFLYCNSSAGVLGVSNLPLNFIYYKFTEAEFHPDAPFLYPLEKSEKRKVFWCFHGVEEGVHWERMG